MPINFCRKCSLIPLGRTVKMCSQKGLWKKNKKNSRFYSLLGKICFRITTLYSHSFLNQIQIWPNTVILHMKRQSETETDRDKNRESERERKYYCSGIVIHNSLYLTVNWCFTSFMFHITLILVSVHIFSVDDSKQIRFSMLCSTWYETLFRFY